jgi:hypothetical protein
MYGVSARSFTGSPPTILSRAETWKGRDKAERTARPIMDFFIETPFLVLRKLKAN